MSSHGATAWGAVPGTLSGTALVLLANVESVELIRTAIVAAVGATVSFVFSLFFQYVKKKFF